MHALTKKRRNKIERSDSYVFNVNQPASSANTHTPMIIPFTKHHSSVILHAPRHSNNSAHKNLITLCVIPICSSHQKNPKRISHYALYVLYLKPQLGGAEHFFSTQRGFLNKWKSFYKGIFHAVLHFSISFSKDHTQKVHTAKTGDQVKAR